MGRVGGLKSPGYPGNPRSLKPRQGSTPTNKREHCSIPFLGIVQEGDIPDPGRVRQTEDLRSSFDSHNSR